MAPGRSNPDSALRCDCGYDFSRGSYDADAKSFRLANRAAGLKNIWAGAAWSVVGLLGAASISTEKNARGFTIVPVMVMIGGVTQLFRGVRQRWPSND
jgi:hypothetical protein